MPKLEEVYGDFIWELKDPVAPEEPPDPVKRWGAMCDDLEESVARCEEALGTLPETGLDAIEDQQIAIDYSARDAHATLAIRSKLRDKVEANGMLELAELDMSVLPYIDAMKTAGIKVNREHMLAYGEQLKIEMRQIQEKLHENLGVWINPSSSQQVGMVIYELLSFPIEIRTETGQPSTNDKVLESLAPLNDNIRLITDYREMHKLRSTYAIKLPRYMDASGRLHTNWKATRVPSGRLASSDPNLMAIPVRTERGEAIRRGFVPEDGFVFVGVDLSQIEMRILAHISKDPNLIDVFEKGLDIHASTAARMWKLPIKEIVADHKINGSKSMRSSAKNCVHPDTLLFNGTTGLPIGSLPIAGVGEFLCVADGLQVYTGSGYTTVASTFNGGVKKMVTIATNRAYLVCSEDHLIEAVSGLKRAGDLLPGDDLPEPSAEKLIVSSAPYAPVPVKVNRFVPPTYVLPTHEHAYFAGAFTGDGCSTRTESGAVSFAHGPLSKIDDYGNPYSEWRDVLLASTRSIGIEPVRIEDRYIHLGRRNLHGYMRGIGLLGDSGKTLRVPVWVLAAGRDAILHFLAGLFDTDGTVGTCGSLEFCTKDPVLAGQVAALLTALGMRIGTAPSYNKTYDRWYYEVRINALSAFEFRNYMRHRGKLGRLRIPSKNMKRVRHHIKHILPAGYWQCLDLNVVSDDHIYIAGSLRTHNCGFGIVYGISSKGLQWQYKSKTGIDYTEEECQKQLDDWFGVYQYVKYYMERQKSFARRDGFVSSLLGRRRYLPGVHSTIPRIREESHRQAINHPVQSGASEVIKIAMRNIWNDALPILWDSGIKVRPILQIHDELCYEVEKGAVYEVAEIIVDKMQTAMILSVPVLADFHVTASGEDGGSWADLK